MKVFPNTFDDLVTPRLFASAWRWLRGHDLRLPAASATLAVHVGLLVASFQMVSHWLRWVVWYGDPYPQQADHAWSSLLSLASSVLIALAGVTCFMLVLLTRRRAFRWTPGISAVLKTHTVVLSLALISIAGLYAYSDGLLAMTISPFFPHCMVLAVATLVAVVCCTQPVVRDRIPPRLAAHLPLLHALALTVMFGFYYKSTIGNVVDVIK